MPIEASLEDNIPFLLFYCVQVYLIEKEDNSIFSGLPYLCGTTPLPVVEAWSLGHWVIKYRMSNDTSV